MNWTGAVEFICEADKTDYFKFSGRHASATAGYRTAFSTRAINTLLYAVYSLSRISMMLKHRPRDDASVRHIFRGDKF